MPEARHLRRPRAYRFLLTPVRDSYFTCTMLIIVSVTSAGEAASIRSEGVGHQGELGRVSFACAVAQGAALHGTPPAGLGGRAQPALRRPGLPPPRDPPPRRPRPRPRRPRPRPRRPPLLPSPQPRPAPPPAGTTLRGARLHHRRRLRRSAARDGQRRRGCAVLRGAPAGGPGGPAEPAVRGGAAGVGRVAGPARGLPLPQPRLLRPAPRALGLPPTPRPAGQSRAVT
jgi:hypothetical protein